jgi:hypothetical protein
MASAIPELKLLPVPAILSPRIWKVAKAVGEEAEAAAAAAAAEAAARAAVTAAGATVAPNGVEFESARAAALKLAVVG